MEKGRMKKRVVKEEDEGESLNTHKDNSTQTNYALSPTSKYKSRLKVIMTSV
jgi:hypothetical protein